MTAARGLAAWLVLAAATSALNLAAAAEPIQRPHFVYYAESPRFIELADSALADARRRLLVLLRDTLPQKASVYIVDDEDSFNRLLRGHFPDWGAAAALPERRTIVVKSPDKFNIGKSLAELLAHEYAHLVVAHRSGFNSAPRWFDEGVAMLVSTEWGWSDNLAMGKAAVFGEFIPLKRIEHVNRFNQNQAQVAYAQSYLAVKYLLDEYESDALNRFLDEIAGGSSVADALTATTGSNYREFEDEFRAYLSQRYNIATLFSDTIYSWLALAIILVVGAALRYRKRRLYYKKWEQEERLQSTDFEYGDPEHPEETDDEDEPWRG